MDDLFSVFTEPAPVDSTEADTKKHDLSADVSADDATTLNETKRAKKKQRKLEKKMAKEAGASEPVMENGNNDKGGKGESRNGKKPSKIEPEPVVTDSFESEQQREVTGNAGLQQTSAEGTVVLSHQMRHQVALPPNYPYVPISQHKFSDNPAKTYKFELDPFQKVSVASIERNESVLVSAHTSAGKTVVAEYAIAQSLREKQRVIYTSPIKALSNQKYRELQETFGDVGLMTGDITINPDASCLVMTTEILRSMLYRGSEVMREMAWVIFDEIHYMRDKERGVVWEETIILLPDNVRYVFLSATIPNAMQFAEWICKTHNQPCHVVYTNFRPTPLQHYLFPAGGDGINLVVDEKGAFREENFQRAMSTLNKGMGDDPSSALAKADKRGKINKGGKKDTPDIYKIIKMLMLRNYYPVIVFSFSKRECENLALKMSSLNFNNSEEQEMASKVFANGVLNLSDADRELPQIKAILPLLRRGIGVHHSGLLPILKEIIELLFQEGLIKVLFATETFSIGLNMPAKTVVFTNVRKWDGREFRWVTGGEYIQMSGRAGRRGIDERGTTILMIDEQMEPAVAKGMVKGEADRLDSAFHLTYNMILNLLRVEGISPEFMLERCFYQFQNGAKVPELEQRHIEIESQYKDFDIEDESTIKEYYDLRQQISGYEKDMVHVITHPQNCLKFLQPGRLIKVVVKAEGNRPQLDFGWASVVSFAPRKKPPRSKDTVFTDHESFVVDVLLWVADTAPVHLLRKGDPKLVTGIKPPASPDAPGRTEIVSITLDSIQNFSNVRIFLPKDVSTIQQRNSVKKSVDEVLRRFPDGIPSLDPVENMHIKDDSFLTILKKIEVLESKLATNPYAFSPALTEVYNKYSAKMELANEMKSLTAELTKARAIMQLDELRSRKRVLRRLGFTSKNDIVEMKGRVACEISSGDELLITELIFDGTFGNLTPEQCASVLSCFVFDESAKEAPALPGELREPLLTLQTMAKNIAKVSRESNVELDEKAYVESFKSQLMSVVFQWCKGSTFAQVCKMTDVYEGSLIRMFRRLEELLRQIATAAKVIENEELEQKMEKAIALIKRDLVSAGSLYTV